MIKHVAIIGLGLIGGSLAKALNKYSDVKITAIDINNDSINSALEAGVISCGIKKLNFAIDADIVFICTPVGKIVETISKIFPYLKSGCIITDVGSTKKTIMDEIKNILPDEIYFIGGHPMAGAEKSGFSHANADLFIDSSYLIMPFENVPENVLKSFIDDVIVKIGAKPILMDYNQHDTVVGVISHVPHIISAAIANFAYKECSEALNYAAGGFKDTTRVALSQTEMWKDIILSNKEVIRNLLIDYKEVLNTFISFLEKNDVKAIEKFFDDARKCRSSIV